MIERPQRGAAALVEIDAIAHRANRAWENALRAGLDAAGMRNLAPIDAMTLVRAARIAPTTTGRLFEGDGNATYRLEKLHGLGLLTCARDEDDGRRVMVDLTEKGRAVAARIEALVDDLNRDMPEVDLEAVALLLRRMEVAWADEKRPEAGAAGR